MTDRILYSEKYYDETHEYRHVMLPKELRKLVPTEYLMTETEWRNLGVQQSTGWIHYLIHDPEPHVLLFKRRRTDTATNSSTQTSQHQPVPNAITVNN